MLGVRRVIGILALVPLCCLALGQLDDTGGYTYGNRPIDKLPKSQAARPEAARAWSEAPVTTYELKLHPKDSFRVSHQGIERLCVVEARRPESDTGEFRLVLYGPGGNARIILAQDSGDWIGPNQRMRAYWLTVWRGESLDLVLKRDGRVVAQCPAPLADGAPPVLFDVTPPPDTPAIDTGFALLPANELVATRDATIRVPVGIPGGLPGPLRIELRDMTRPDTPLLPTSYRLEDATPRVAGGTCFDTRELTGSEAVVRAAAVRDGQVLAQQDFKVHLVDRPPPVRFGARYADLRYTAPVMDGDRERTWDDYWGKSAKRDVVVSFPGKPYRLVLWRGASYVPCWALPEAWLCYEWLEAEPYFYGAVDCVEPIMDKDCRYSRAEIVSSTPARAVIRWQYALTDFEGKIIRGEHAEEMWTIYPDGVGTRHLRGYYESGWHENHEFIVINRPGSRPSLSLDPQAITFLDTEGHRQDPAWPKPGFSLDGWPNVISVVNIGGGPRPFMVTPDAPTQVKVWAEPFLDKPDLFNSYPHWPVTRGMLTAWLDDPAQFQRPSHTNLVNLVNSPLRSTEKEKDWVWLVGMADSSQEAVEAAACWLKPGKILPGPGTLRGEYSLTDRAYLIKPHPNAKHCEFTLVPEPGTPVVNPAFVVEGWEGTATVRIAGADEVRGAQEKGRFVVWAEDRFGHEARVTLNRG